MRRLFHFYFHTLLYFGIFVLKFISMYLFNHSVCIRSIRQTDDQAYFDIFSHPQVALYDDFTPIKQEDLDADMKRIALYDDQSLFCEYAVALIESDLMIGVLTVDRKRKFTYLGYHFNPAYQGKGYAVASVQLFLSSLDEVSRKLVRLVIDPQNAQSIKLALKVGFVKIKSRVKNKKQELIFGLR